MAEQRRLEKLRAALGELEAELARTDAAAIGPDARAALEHVRAEIEQALAEQDLQALERRSLIERLREAEREFETQHPALADLVLRLVNALGQMGI